MQNNLEINKTLLRSLPSEIFSNKNKNKILLVFGSLGDLDSFEYSQLFIQGFSSDKLKSYEYFAIGIGSLEAKQHFCEYTGFPPNRLFILKDSSIHTKLGLSEGLTFGFPKFINMLLMCIGISSPGTLKEVIRGYLGDKSAHCIFTRGKHIQLSSYLGFSSNLFDLIGHGYQRPFELATLRLLNMLQIIRNWDLYFPDLEYITQRGATFVLDKNNKLVYSYRSNALLIYSESNRDPLAFIKKIDNGNSL